MGGVLRVEEVSVFLAFPTAFADVHVVIADGVWLGQDYPAGTVLALLPIHTVLLGMVHLAVHLVLLRIDPHPWLHIAHRHSSVVDR
jgi:hypothetical protein